MRVNSQLYAHLFYLTAYLPLDMATSSTQYRTAWHIDGLRWIFPQGVFPGAQGKEPEVEKGLVGHLNTRTVRRFCREIKEANKTSSQQNERDILQTTSCSCLIGISYMTVLWHSITVVWARSPTLIMKRMWTIINLGRLIVEHRYIRAWTNGKCLTTKHHQTLFGNQTFYRLDTCLVLFDRV